MQNPLLFFFFASGPFSWDPVAAPAPPLEHLEVCFHIILSISEPPRETSYVRGCKHIELERFKWVDYCFALFFLKKMRKHNRSQRNNWETISLHHEKPCAHLGTSRVVYMLIRILKRPGPPLDPRRKVLKQKKKNQWILQKVWF